MSKHFYERSCADHIFAGLPTILCLQLALSPSAWLFITPSFKCARSLSLFQHIGCPSLKISALSLICALWLNNSQESYCEAKARPLTSPSYRCHVCPDYTVYKITEWSSWGLVTRHKIDMNTLKTALWYLYVTWSGKLLSIAIARSIVLHVHWN